MKFKALCIILAVASLPAFAAQTLQFSTAAGRSTRHATATSGDYGPLAGNDVGGLNWGIVVDTSATQLGLADFSGAGQNASNSYFAFSSLVTVSQTLRNGIGGLTDDLYFASANFSSDSSGFGVTGNGAGGFGTLTNIALPNYSSAGIAAGQKFALIWFNDNTAETNGVDKYGFFYDSSFVLPADAGGSTPMGGIFAGLESSDKLANITFGAIPEPSRMMLLGFGLVGLFYRRRR
ncbi:MAG: PEP-CTERM sorting domain-containing protein [Prosthecobacter sp.]